MLGVVVRYEWLILEFAVLGWAVWELWSLNRSKPRGERAKASPASGAAPDEKPPQSTANGSGPAGGSPG